MRNTDADGRPGDITGSSKPKKTRTKISALTKAERAAKNANDKLKAERKKARAKSAALNAQRAKIIGEAIRAELETNPALQAQLQPIIEARVTKAAERKILDLTPLQKPSRGGTEGKEKRGVLHTGLSGDDPLNRGGNSVSGSDTEPQGTKHFGEQNSASEARG